VANEVLEATKRWVGSYLNNIPTSLVAKGTNLKELTSPQEGLPSWGTMWSFKVSLDEDWALESISKMQEIGFRVFECDELPCVFGIDAGGYDFFKHHWVPLYLARGLEWHED